MTYNPSGFVAAVLDGHTFLMAFNSREEMVELMKWLKERNAEKYLDYRLKNGLPDMVVQFQEAIATQGKIDPIDIYRTQNTAPICKRHKTPMVKSQKDIGGWYCKGHDGQGNYCKNFVSSKGKVRNEE